jgi:hypothetical protein
LYSLGSHGAAKRFMKAQSKAYPELEKYLKALDEIKVWDKTIITTHDRLLLSEEFPNSQVIIDEDVIPTLLKQDEIKVGDIAALCANNTVGENHVLRRLLKALLDAEVNTVHKMELEFKWEYSKEIQTLAERTSSVIGNILGFFFCSYWLKDKDKPEKIKFITRREDFPPGKKIIILSATANEMIYRRMYGERLDFVDIGIVTTVGKIKQYTQWSYSRANVKEDENLNIAKVITGNKPVITFKNQKKQFPEVKATFGNLTGLDSFAGEEMVVVGTYHLNPTVYLLYAHALGYKPVDASMSYRIIERNGMEFYFFTFNDEVLREIQLAFIEAELMQAVGRARILRNDCIVTVLSNLPIIGAEYVYLSRKEVETMLSTS